MHFKGGEEEALKRLQHYFFESKSLSTYFETRNDMLGANYSSKFSPWLALGCISPRYIYAQIKIYEGLYGSNKSSYWLVFELMWRDYFRFMMKKHQQKFFSIHGLKKQGKMKSQMDIMALEHWKNGTTGSKYIDANMIELNRTGFMSNRGRQNVASYFCHQLKMDWRYGAAYFEEQLIDYDVSSNWGNWMYIAGVGNDPRESRVFNIEKQAEMYDKNGLYRNMWLTAE
ncbi:MAG TPA: DASH family cryptochrome [Bacteroidia bacterium]|nr:DASH family cryptochrome [Bacteroidia bacterium]